MPDSEGWGQAQSGNLIVTLIPVLVWLLALLFAVIAIWRGPRPITWGMMADRLIRYILVFPLGLQGLWAFFGHVFLPEESAASIGWAASPFQTEVGMANLGLALASFYAAFGNFGARAAAAIGASCFLAGAGVVHLMDIAEEGNIAPGNAGPILVTDFLTPIAILALLIVFPRRAEPVGVTETVQRSLVARIEDAQGEASPPRIEDEIEKARKAMRGALTAGPTPEVLSPVERPVHDRPRMGKRAMRKSRTDLPET